MDDNIAFIGFGEAGQAFAGIRSRGRATAFDRKIVAAATRDAKERDYAALDIDGATTPADALREATAILCLVTADQAVAAAADYAPFVAADSLWLDMNSVAPESKRRAAEAIHAAGGRYADVAIMSPVNPAKLDVPLLVSGPHAGDAVAVLKAAGFGNVGAVGDRIGAASAIKMIRSVMVKGIEALTAECVLAADAAGVRDEVIASLDASWPGADWARRADYNLDRMMVHGERRAAEMEEVVKTLDGLGTGSAMSRGTVARQRAIGALGITPPAGLDAKLEALAGENSIIREQAA